MGFCDNDNGKSNRSVRSPRSSEISIPPTHTIDPGSRAILTKPNRYGHIDPPTRRHRHPNHRNNNQYDLSCPRQRSHANATKTQTTTSRSLQTKIRLVEYASVFRTMELSSCGTKISFRLLWTEGDDSSGGESGGSGWRE